MEVSTYTPIPLSRSKEFWTKWKISHIRQLAQSGHATQELLMPESEKTTRVLDQLRLKESTGTVIKYNEIDTSVPFARGSDLLLSSPLYLGDMSFGALSGIPNIAIARTADATGILAGTGEGGVQKEVADCRRITVQWASARFGVDISSLKLGQGVVIKIGQGAKPGIGGHLPGVKVTQPISEARRIPVGRDAISPAPHHDIYSIEDLGQRILALKEATKKPVFVKVGATNYIPFIASGIARMGGAGIIIDGAGAGTGAAPSVIKSNVGIPIELAVASVDSILKREGLREGFTVIAAGKVSCPEDSLKLIALGADVTSLGTAALLALGCLMVHKCHLGFCPAMLTNKISENQVKILSLNQSVVWLTNMVNGWSEEMKLLLQRMGLSNVRELRGHREFLSTGDGLNTETLHILGISEEKSDYHASGVYPTLSGNPWTLSRVTMLREMAGTTGKSATEPEISSMGAISPPFVETPSRIADWLVADGAQVTRPSIDPYREEIETTTYIPRSPFRVAAPIFFTHLPESTSADVRKTFARTAFYLGLLLDSYQSEVEPRSRYSERVISTHPESGLHSIDLTELQNATLGDSNALFLRVPSNRQSIEWVEGNVQQISNSVLGFIVDEDMVGTDIPLEISVAQLDKKLKSRGTRSIFAILGESNGVRGADDIFKILALGADLVGLGKAALTAIGYEEDREMIFDGSKSMTRLENFVIAVEKEIKLLAGAAGVSSVASSLVGNRELLRSINLSPQVRKELEVKPAGAA